MKNVNRLFYCLLASLLATSCSSNVTITADTSLDYYEYSIGEGETVYARNNSTSSVNKEYSDFINTYDVVANDCCTIDSVKLKNGLELDSDVISVSNTDRMYSLSLTCLKSFDDEIEIDRIIYDFDGTLVDFKYNIELTYNANYKSNPSFPGSYFSVIGELWYLDPSSDLFCDSTRNTFYLKFSRYGLDYENSDSFIVNSLASNSDLFSINDIKYGIIPVNGGSYSTYCWRIDYNNFEKIDLKDFELGFVLQFKISYDEENIRSVGGDVKFNIEVNGDAYDIFYHIYYSAFG